MATTYPIVVASAQFCRQASFETCWTPNFGRLRGSRTPALGRVPNLAITRDGECVSVHVLYSGEQGIPQFRQIAILRGMFSSASLVVDWFVPRRSPLILSLLLNIRCSLAVCFHSMASCYFVVVLRVALARCAEEACTLPLLGGPFSAELVNLTTPARRCAGVRPPFV